MGWLADESGWLNRNVQILADVTKGHPLSLPKPYSSSWKNEQLVFHPGFGIFFLFFSSQGTKEIYGSIFPFLQ